MHINASSSQLGHCKPLLVAQVQQTTRRCNHDVHIISLQTIDIITWAAVELSGWPFDTGRIHSAATKITRNTPPPKTKTLRKIFWQLNDWCWCHLLLASFFKSMYFPRRPGVGKGEGLKMGNWCRRYFNKVRQLTLGKFTHLQRQQQQQQHDNNDNNGILHFTTFQQWHVFPRRQIMPNCWHETTCIWKNEGPANQVGGQNLLIAAAHLGSFQKSPTLLSFLLVKGLKGSSFSNSCLELRITRFSTDSLWIF